MHALSFLGSFLRCFVTCDAKAQLESQPNLYFCSGVRCTAELWRCPEHCTLEKSVPVSSWFDASTRVNVFVQVQHFSTKFGEELVLFAKGDWWSSGVVVLPGRHFLVVWFEQAHVKTFQLHNMGNEAERYVGVVSLSPPFYRNLATRCLGYILGIPHVQVVQFDHKAVGEICSNLLHSKVWNTQFFCTSLHYCRPVAPLSILRTYCESCFVSI